MPRAAPGPRPSSRARCGTPAHPWFERTHRNPFAGGPGVREARRMTDDLASLEQLWPPFALRVTCGPLVMRPLRDDDFPEVLATVHAGIHAPDRMPFSFPWTD